MADFDLKRLEESARTWKSTTEDLPYQCLNIIGSLKRLRIYTRWWVLRRLLLNHHRLFRWGCWVGSREDDDRDNKYYYLRSGCGGGLKDGGYSSIDKGTLFAIDSPSLGIDCTYLEALYGTGIMKEKYVLASNCARSDTLFKALAIDEDGNLTLNHFALGRAMGMRILLKFLPAVHRPIKQYLPVDVIEFEPGKIRLIYNIAGTENPRAFSRTN